MSSDHHHHSQRQHKSSRTSQKLRKTNESIIISEIRSLNSRVAELLQQFGLLTMEIANVADDLERHQKDTDTVRRDLKSVKKQFTKVNEVLKDTQKKVGILDRKLTRMEQNDLKIGTYHLKEGEDSGDE
jgi:chromosome segregation ATPase